MTTIALASLSAVVGGVSLQPGATADTPNPVIAGSGPKLGLQPGATADTAHPVIRLHQHPLGLKPGSIE